MARITGFGKDLVADGYKLVSLSAPALSIFIALAKWQGWSVIEINFAEISWAWVFAPITVWFFIAYLRRWLKFQTIEIERDNLREIKDYEGALDLLSQYFDEGNNDIFNRPVASKTEFNKWQTDWRAWEGKVQNHLEEHFGLREKNMFANLVIVHTPSFPGFCADHSFYRRCIAQELETLRETIVRHSDKVQKWRAANT